MAYMCSYINLHTKLKQKNIILKDSSLLVDLQILLFLDTREIFSYFFSKFLKLYFNFFFFTQRDT